MEKDVQDAIAALHEKIDSKNERMTDKFDKLNDNISKLLTPLGTLSAKVESQGKLIWWIFGIIAGMVATILAPHLKG